MKYIKTFEDLDHLSFLKAEKDLRDQAGQARESEVEKRRNQMSGKHLDTLKVQGNDKDVVVKERQEIIQRVIDGLTSQLNKNAGFQSFKEELLVFLDEFPKE